MRGLISALQGIARAGFTTRALGDFSEPLSQQALARLEAALGIDEPHRAHQVHGAEVRVVGGKGRWHEAQADALIARDAPVAVRVADCLPLLLADAKSGYVAAVHAGWRGLVAGVVEAAVGRMQALGVAEERLRAAIGPHIRPCCFAVGEDVAHRLAAAGCTLRARNGRIYADLASAVVRKLVMLGVRAEAIEDRTACTACDSRRFFSWRARREKVRMLAVIAPGG